MHDLHDHFVFPFCVEKDRIDITMPLGVLGNAIHPRDTLVIAVADEELQVLQMF